MTAYLSLAKFAIRTDYFLKKVMSVFCVEIVACRELDEKACSSVSFEMTCPVLEANEELLRISVGPPRKCYARCGNFEKTGPAQGTIVMESNDFEMQVAVTSGIEC